MRAWSCLAEGPGSLMLVDMHVLQSRHILREKYSDGVRWTYVKPRDERLGKGVQGISFTSQPHK